nr:B-lymphocyte antigen CD20-like isoform X1 [Podarcis muralis]XP_028593757.1 B-lymphocyte antigen CD20-like isoform X1 [Podarcis muralis]XP_028593767.1 B-lymphocyte antigen CD20-like isoform X1 [Podarcis muralis]
MRMDQYRLAPQAPYPGNVVVVVPPSHVGAGQKKLPEENDALGAMQVAIALIHLGLGGILLFSSKDCDTWIMTVWYPFWGGALFIISGCLSSAATRKSVAGLGAFSYLFNTLSGLGAIAGMCLLLTDVIKNRERNFSAVTETSHFVSKFLLPQIPNISNYCKTTGAYEMGILCVMLFFSFLEATTTFSVLCNSKDKKKHRSDNEEQNVALTSLPQPRYADGVPDPPQYTATEANRYSQLPESIPGNTHTDWPRYAAGYEPYTG